MGCGVPIILEKFLTVDCFATCFLLSQPEKSALHLDLDADLGCRIYISSYEQTLSIARIKETRDIQGLRWFPGPVAYPSKFSLLIVDKQPECILRLWSDLECNSYMMPEMSGMREN